MARPRTRPIKSVISAAEIIFPKLLISGIRRGVAALRQRIAQFHVRPWQTPGR
jgi:hypothetical protein